ncbi:hypothetical protein ABAC460_22850 [Asticcacaulis sp. AC460]|uniref:hypothetical protein n=1 Tax=Asticcacaulis sp. AC460 TaxID=1282360 RepID=UPI0003C3E946|nr:hypothetical protein [Asticcacaulis sp. AC460]ESQ86670.1 hypothetical protein ABAC460_22850 [Asticcacaulis sp. AC460]
MIRETVLSCLMIAAVLAGFVYSANLLTPGHWDPFDTAIVAVGVLLITARLSAHLGRLSLRHPATVAAR